MEKSFPEYSKEQEHYAVFASKLEAYASSSLSSRERQILLTLIMNVIDPLERIRWKDASSLLHPKEDEYLCNLQNEYGVR